MQIGTGIATREVYGPTLIELRREGKDIVALDADLAKSTTSIAFGKEFPDRFFYAGIAEQNMIGMAAGLAVSGKTVFASTFAVFATARCFDQLRVSVAQPHLNVKVVATHAGVTVGEDGISHHGIEDLSLMCSLPGFTVIVPSDAVEAAQAIRAAAENDGPFYIRLTRPKVSVIHDQSYRFRLGKAERMREGPDATIVACGIMVAAALEAAEALDAEGIRCRVLNMATIKPLDREAVLLAAAETGGIVTAEEHLKHGGLGSEVAQVLAEGCPVPMGFVALNDTYAESGTPMQLLQKYGLTPEAISREVKAVVERKRRTNGHNHG